LLRVKSTTPGIYTLRLGFLCTNPPSPPFDIVRRGRGIDRKRRPDVVAGEEKIGCNTLQKGGVNVWRERERERERERVSDMVLRWDQGRESIGVSVSLRRE